MSIQSNTTYDGLKYNLDNYHQVAGQALWDGNNFFSANNTFTTGTVPNYSNAVTVTGDTTWAYATHANKPLIVTATATITLPAVENLKGDIWIINGAADGTLLTVSPNSSDMFLWDIAGAAGTNDKDIINTAATAKKGDYVKLRYGSGDGWLISEIGGTWVDQG